MRAFLYTVGGMAALLLLVTGAWTVHHSCRPEQLLTRPTTIRILDGKSWNPIVGARVTMTTTEPRMSVTVLAEKFEGFAAVPALKRKLTGCFNLEDDYVPSTLHIEADGYKPVDVFLAAGDDSFDRSTFFRTLRRPQIALLERNAEEPSTANAQR